MEIINESCYNTEDLEALFQKVEETCKELSIDHFGQTGFKQNLYDLPLQVVIGYYRPRDRLDPYSKTPNYVNRTGGRRTPRIGIVKPSAFDIAPLVALAQAIDTDDFFVPADVVCDITKVVTGLLGHWGSVRGDRWSWVTSFKLRYSLRAKRGARTRVKNVRDRRRLKRLEKELELCKNDILCFQQKAFNAAEAQVKRLAMIKTLKKRLGE